MLYCACRHDDALLCYKLVVLQWQINGSLAAVSLTAATDTLCEWWCHHSLTKSGLYRDMAVAECSWLWWRCNECRVVRSCSAWQHHIEGLRATAEGRWTENQGSQRQQDQDQVARLTPAVCVQYNSIVQELDNPPRAPLSTDLFWYFLVVWDLCRRFIQCFHPKSCPLVFGEHFSQVWFIVTFLTFLVKNKQYLRHKWTTFWMETLNKSFV